MRRLRHRRRAARYCLWGHHGNLVQVGSQTDRRCQHRLAIEARRRRGLVKLTRQLDISTRLWNRVGVKASDAMRHLAKAVTAMGYAHPAPAIQALNEMGRLADRVYIDRDMSRWRQTGITFGPATVYVAPVGTTVPAVDGEPEPPWKRLA